MGIMARRRQAQLAQKNVRLEQENTELVQEEKKEEEKTSLKKKRNSDGSDRTGKS